MSYGFRLTAFLMSFSLVLPVLALMVFNVVSGPNPGIGVDRFLFFVSLRFC